MQEPRAAFPTDRRYPSLDGIGAIPTHVVQFYESDSFLCEAVASVLARGVTAGQPILVIATPAHHEGIRKRLSAMDLDGACAADRALWFDARDTLSAIMEGATIDAERFRKLMDDTFDELCGSAPVTVCVYGEMVDLLRQDGLAAAALRLEELWNELAATRTFALVCGYAIAGFSEAAHSKEFLDVCHQHVHVFPTERYTATDDAARLEEVAVLQQRALALERETERYLTLEQSARSADRLKDEFLAVISHELRTPLNAILGWAQLAGRPDGDSVMMARALRVIERNARLQLHVINDVLDMSRLVTGKMTMQMVAVDLLEVLTDVIETVQPAAKAKAIELDLHIDDRARSATGDRDRLQQIFWNLVSNAIKFTPVRGQVDVCLDRVEGHAQVSVRDNGQGMSPAFLACVFDKFRQADTSLTRTHGGLGLGLALVRHLVEAHGGTASATSAGIGMGATFTVRLPIRSAVDEILIGPAVPESAELRDRRVLVVDDEADARELFDIALREAGASVQLAASVDEAWHLLATDRFDALVSDIVMPEWDGYALIDLVRRHPNAAVSGICAVAVTSYGNRDRALGAGYDHYLPKPFIPRRLVQVIDNTLRTRRPHVH